MYLDWWLICKTFNLANITFQLSQSPRCWPLWDLQPWKKKKRKKKRVIKSQVLAPNATNALWYIYRKSIEKQDPVLLTCMIKGNSSNWQRNWSTVFKRQKLQPIKYKHSFRQCWISQILAPCKTFSLAKILCNWVKSLSYEPQSKCIMGNVQKSIEKQGKVLLNALA